MAASSTLNRWIRPEVYPLFASVAVAVGFCGFTLIRNITINPDVRVTKENRAAGVLDNHAEGEKYARHFLREFVRGKSSEVMPNINAFFANPEQKKFRGMGKGYQKDEDPVPSWYLGDHPASVFYDFYIVG